MAVSEAGADPPEWAVVLSGDPAEAVLLPSDVVGVSD
jgi:hypothetical protein